MFKKSEPGTNYDYKLERLKESLRSEGKNPDEEEVAVIAEVTNYAAWSKIVINSNKMADTDDGCCILTARIRIADFYRFQQMPFIKALSLSAAVMPNHKPNQVVP